MPRGITSGPGAVVLREQINPIALAMDLQARKQRQEQLNLARQQKIQEARTKKWTNEAKFNPDAFAEPYRAEIMEDMNQYQNALQGMIMAGADPDRAMPAILRMQREINAKAQRSNYLNDQAKEIRDEYTNNQFLDNDIMDRKLDAVMYGKGINEIDITNLRGQVYDNTSAFQVDEYSKHVLDNADETIIKNIQEKYSKQGLVQDTEEIKSKLYLTTLNLDGSRSLAKDDAGNPIINVNDDVVFSYMSDDIAARNVRETLAANGYDPNNQKAQKSLIEQRLSPLAYAHKNILSRKEADSATQSEKTQQAAFNDMTLLLDKAIDEQNPAALTVAFGAPGTEIEIRQPVGPGETHPTIVGKYRKAQRDPYTQILTWQDLPIDIPLDDPVTAKMELARIINESDPTKAWVDRKKLFRHYTEKAETPPSYKGRTFQVGAETHSYSDLRQMGYTDEQIDSAIELGNVTISK